jgi:hypothetical protein
MSAGLAALAGPTFVAAIVLLIEDVVVPLLRLSAFDSIAPLPLLVGTLAKLRLLLDTLPLLWGSLDP